MQTGELRQQVREFFDINRQDAGPIQQIMTKEIRVPSNVGQNFTDTSIGRFVVSQLEKSIQSPNVAPNLQTAIRESIKDDRNLTLLELIENYPTDQVTLNITGLVQSYNDVSAFVDRVLPALEVAKEYLQDIICDCQQPAATEQPTPTPTDAPRSSLDGDRSATACSTPSPTAMAVPAASSAAHANSMNRVVPAPALPTQTP